MPRRILIMCASACVQSSAPGNREHALGGETIRRLVARTETRNLPRVHIPCRALCTPGCLQYFVYLDFAYVRKYSAPQLYRTPQQTPRQLEGTRITLWIGQIANTGHFFENPVNLTAISVFIVIPKVTNHVCTVNDSGLSIEDAGRPGTNKIR